MTSGTIMESSPHQISSIDIFTLPPKTKEENLRNILGYDFKADLHN